MASNVPCAIKKDTQQLYCWGYDTGEAYSGAFPQSSTLTLLPGKTKWKSLGVNSWSSSRCAIDENDKVCVGA